MTRKALFKDRRGTTAVEFALTAPVFFLMFFGLWQIGYGLWWQFGLQHGAQMAARCMTIKPRPTLGPPPVDCTNTAGIQSYAASQSYGLNPSPSIFKVNTPPIVCSNGNQITAYYEVPLIVANIGPSYKLHAQACHAT
jgi:Flp pilus assembly protein TadG